MKNSLMKTAIQSRIKKAIALVFRLPLAKIELEYGSTRVYWAFYVVPDQVDCGYIVHSGPDYFNLRTDGSVVSDWGTECGKWKRYRLFEPKPLELNLRAKPRGEIR